MIPQPVVDSSIHRMGLDSSAMLIKVLEEGMRESACVNDFKRPIGITKRIDQKHTFRAIVNGSSTERNMTSHVLFDSLE